MTGKILRVSVFLCVIANPCSLSALELSFGLYASDKASTLVTQFRPILNQLEAKLSRKLKTNVKIRMQIAKNYQIGVQELVEGKVDFARFGPASYVQAKAQNPRLDILAMESNQGTKFFNGVICVNANSNIFTVSDLKGKNFAFGSQRSTIGRYLSQSYLADHQVTVAKLNNYKYLGRHDKVAAAVAQGLFDAGAVKESTFLKMRRKGLPLRIIAKFKNTTKPWIASATLKPEIKAALSQSLLSLKDPAALAALKKDGFLPGKDQDYQAIRIAMQDERFFAE